MFKLLGEFLRHYEDNLRKATPVERVNSVLRAKEARRSFMANAERERMARYAPDFHGSCVNVSNPAVMAHNLAVLGAIDPKVAFSLGAPGAPDGTGRMVGINGAYRG